jgi:uncharacterized protein
MATNTKTGMDWLALILVIIGGLNWGLIGLLEFDLVEYLFGAMSVLTRVVYSLVGIAALWMIYFVTKD